VPQAKAADWVSDYTQRDLEDDKTAKLGLLLIVKIDRRETH